MVVKILEECPECGCKKLLSGKRDSHGIKIFFIKCDECDFEKTSCVSVHHAERQQ